MWQPAFHAIFFIVFSLQCGGYSLLVNRLREISMNGFDDTGKDKFKVVTPDKIASLFTSKSARTPLSTRRTVEVPITNISPTTGKTENAALMEASADSGIEVNDIINPYDNFSKELNAQRQRQVSRVLSMGTSASTINTLTRTVTAVTTDRATNRYRGHNPMNFGAYKRFKEAGQKDGRASVGGVGGVRGKKRKKGVMSADSFYDAIKKLGSGPVGKGTTARTGVVEPSPRQKPIQPKKAPIKGSNRRRIITPDDIRSLFAKPADAIKQQQQPPDPLADYEDMDSSDTDDAAEEEDGKGGGERGVYEVVSAAPARRSRQRSPSNSGNSDFAVLSLQGGSEGGDGDEIPKWLKDADRQDRLRRRKGPRKPKPLLKDWRFWAAGILVVGCVAAFVNMYQMTGGFGTMDSAIADKFNGFSD